MSKCEILQGDCRQILATLPEGSVHTCVTSPAYYGLRNYQTEPQQWADGWCGELGGEPTPQLYIAHLVEVFEAVHRVLRPEGILWCVVGDSYNAAGRVGHGTSIGPKQQTNRASATGQDHVRATAPGLKPKDLIGIPWMLAFALRDAGWYLRSDIIWNKTAAMPESVQDRPTKSHEYIFLLTKNERYYYDAVAIAEPLAPTNAQRSTARYNTAQRYGAGNGGNTGLDSLATRMRAGTHTTRNARSVWSVGPSPLMKLRDDLTPEQKAYVTGELLRRGLL